MKTVIDCIKESLEKLRIRNNKLWEVAYLFDNNVEISRAVTPVYENGKIIGHITIKYSKLVEKKDENKQESMFC